MGNIIETPSKLANFEASEANHNCSFECDLDWQAKTFDVPGVGHHHGQYFTISGKMLSLQDLETLLHD